MERQLNSKKIKYKILSPLIEKEFKSGDHIVLYFNFNSLLSSLYMEKIANSIANTSGHKRLAICANIMNLVGHYRHFFSSRFGVSTSIVFYYDNGNSKINNKYVYTYGDKIRHRKSKDGSMYDELNHVIDLNIKLIKKLVEYTTDCHFIEPKDFEPSCVPYYFIDKIDNENVRHLIITMDKYDYQMVDTGTRILRLKYDDTFIINDVNVYRHIINDDTTDVTGDELNVGLIPLVYAIAGIKSRSVSGVNGYGMIRTIKKLTQLIEEGSMVNSFHVDVSGIAELISDNEQVRKIIRDNYEAISIRKQNKVLITDEMKEWIDSQVSDNFNMKSMISINDDYFSSRPIVLDYLFEGLDSRFKLKDLIK